MIMHKSNKKIKILHIVLSISETNSTYNEHCLPMAEEREITICTFYKSILRPISAIRFFEGDNSVIGFFRILKAALNANPYDIIHAHSPHVGFMLLLVLLFYERRFFSSTVITVHDSYPNFKLRNRLFLMPVFACFRRVVCCGKASFDSFPTFYKWLAKDRLRFVQNGLDIARIDRISEKIRRRAMGPHRFVIVATSRLVEIKNPFSVLLAYAQTEHENLSLKYMGEGHLRQALDKKLSVLKLEDKVEFTGLVPREKVYENLINADLFISASRGEGLPIAVLEAMACGCPVLLSDIAPHREIAEGVDFIPLVGAEDLEGFAGEINRFKEMTVAKIETVGEKCRALVMERFSLMAMHAGYGDIYDQIIGKTEHALVADVR